MSRHVVEGFPEITRLEPRCACCKLASRHPDILRKVHEAHRANATGADIFRMLEDYLGEGNAPSRGAVRRHLTEHVNFAATTLEASSLPAEKAPKPPALHIVPLIQGQELPEGGIRPIQEMPVSREEADEDGQGPNDELWGLYDGVRDVLRKVSPDALFDKEDGKLATFQVNAWTSVVREARQLLDGIHKVQSANKTLDKVVQAHTKRFVVAFAHTLEREMLPIVLKARDHRTSNMQVADELETFLRVKLGDLIGQAAETALRETREEHRISEVGS